MTRKIYVFLSATTHDLGHCRAAAARILREEKKLEAIDEGSFATMEYRAVRRHLWELIQRSDLVLFLVGWRFGGEPIIASPGEPRRSFTQLEWDFAEALGKPRIVFLASEGSPFDQGAELEPEELRALQRQHREAVSGAGVSELWHSFTSLAEMERLVRAIDFAPHAPQRTRKACVLPYPSLGPLFIGREGELAALRSQLLPSHSPATPGSTQTIHGLGGIGKTRLAVEYAYACAEHFGALLFLSAETPEGLALNLSRLASPEALALCEPEEEDEQRQREAVLHWLEREPGWLLIFDNVDSPEAAAAVCALLPRLGRGHVIITSRLSEWNVGGSVMALGALEEAASVAYLLAKCMVRREEPDDASSAAVLAGDLGGLALALEQASAFINLHGLSFREYRERWVREDMAVREWFDEKLMLYPRSVATTWETSFAELREEARAVLRLLCWLSAEPAPRGLFRTVTAIERVAARLGPSCTKLLPALKELGDYSLLHRAGPDAVQIHRLVQEVTRARLPEGPERSGWLGDCLSMVDAYATGNPYEPRNWRLWDPLRPHILALADWSEKANRLEPAGRLLNQVGVLLLRKAAHAESAGCLRRALRFRGQAFGPRSAEVAGIEINLGTVAERLDQLPEAEQHYLEAHAILEECELGESAEAAMVLNNLAALQVGMNRFPEAAVTIARAIALDRQRLPATDPEFAPSLSNHGVLLWRTGRYAEAEAACREALTIMERAHGANFPEVSTMRSNLGLILQDLGRFAEAEACFRTALAADREVFGPEHPAVGRDANNLALLLRARGNLREAEQLLRTTLEQDRRNFGESHSEVADGYNNLGLVLTDLKRDGEAEDCFRRALAIDETVHGASHLRVANACSNLGSALKDRGELGEAFQFYQRALDIQRDKLGPEHPDLASTWNNLGHLMQLSGELRLARAALRHAMSIDRKAFGRRSPRLGTRLSNLAQIHWQEGRLDRAERLYRAALQADRLIHGPDHPEIAVDLYNLAELLRTRGREAEARAQHAEAVRIARESVEREAEGNDPRLLDIVEKWEALPAS